MSSAPSSPCWSSRWRWTARVALASLATFTAARRAAADEDGAYGRFDGDLELGLGAGVEVGPDPARAALRGTALYLGMAGLALGYEDALAAGHPRGRTLGLGPELRPLFIPRWSNALDRGPALLDLTLDSLALGLGAWYGTGADGPLGRERGLEAWFGLGVPLIARAAGPWLEVRATARWRDGAREVSPPPVGAALVYLTWRGRVESPLAQGM